MGLKRIDSVNFMIGGVSAAGVAYTKWKQYLEDIASGVIEDVLAKPQERAEKLRTEIRGKKFAVFYGRNIKPIYRLVSPSE